MMLYPLPTLPISREGRQQRGTLAQLTCLENQKGPTESKLGKFRSAHASVAAASITASVKPFCHICRICSCIRRPTGAIAATAAD